MIYGHDWSRVRRYPPQRWRCRRCGRRYRIRTWWPCALQLALDDLLAEAAA